MAKYGNKQARLLRVLSVLLALLLTAVLLSVIGSFLRGLDLGSAGSNILLGLFIGTFDHAWMTGGIFPLFNWFIFVAAGQSFGDKYQFLHNKKRFHAISLLVGTLLCAVYIYVSFHVEQSIFKGLTSEIYLAHRPIFDAIICLPINVGLISLFYFIGQLIPQKLVPVLIHPSRHINQYYCISWVIIMSTSHLSLSLVDLCTDKQVIIAWICILVVTILSVLIYSKYLKERTESFFGKHRKFWTVFVWTTCIASFILAMCLFDEYPNFMNGYDVG